MIIESGKKRMAWEEEKVRQPWKSLDKGTACICQDKPDFSNRWLFWEKQSKPLEYAVEAGFI